MLISPCRVVWSVYATHSSICTCGRRQQLETRYIIISQLTLEHLRGSTSTSIRPFKNIFECHHIRISRCLSLGRCVRNVLRLHSHLYRTTVSVPPWDVSSGGLCMLSPSSRLDDEINCGLVWGTRVGLNSIKPQHTSECEMQATDQTQNIWRVRDKRKHLSDIHISQTHSSGPG